MTLNTRDAYISRLRQQSAGSLCSEADVIAIVRRKYEARHRSTS
jgi:hypothetical protein